MTPPPFSPSCVNVDADVNWFQQLLRELYPRPQHGLRTLTLALELEAVGCALTRQPTEKDAPTLTVHPHAAGVTVFAYLDPRMVNSRQYAPRPQLYTPVQPAPLPRPVPEGCVTVDLSVDPRWDA